MMNALTLRDELIQRGLPPHVADGFVMNFEDESGLNPGINEIAPTVPGSRGGYGLAQWTGPRRTALEQFAAATGRDVSDPEAQLDFLMTELQGPESAAMQHILATGDAGDAGAAVAQYFLRPAQQNLDRRVAEYQGGSGNALRGPDFVPQGDGRQERMNALLAALQPQQQPQMPQSGVLDPFGAYRAGSAARYGV
jgi:hypothetical protein